MNIFNHWKFILNFLNYKDIINLSYVSKKLNYFVKKDIANQIKKFPDIFVINYDNLPFLLENNQFEFSFNKNILIKYCTNIKNFKFLIEKN